jgi:hypothetical protein
MCAVNDPDELGRDVGLHGRQSECAGAKGSAIQVPASCDLANQPPTSPAEGSDLIGRQPTRQELNESFFRDLISPQGLFGVITHGATLHEACDSSARSAMPIKYRPPALLGDR